MTSSGPPSVQQFSAPLPVGAPSSQQTARLAFADMHPGSGSSTPGSGFPSGGCTMSPPNPQEKPRLYATCDLERCVDDSGD